MKTAPKKTLTASLLLTAALALISTCGYAATDETLTAIAAPGSSPDSANSATSANEAFWTFNSQSGPPTYYNYTGAYLSSSPSGWAMFNTGSYDSSTSTNNDVTLITQTGSFDGGALTVGQTLSFNITPNTNINPGGSIGFSLLSTGGTGITVSSTNNSLWTYSDSATTTGYLSTAQDTDKTTLEFSLTLTGAGTYSASLSGGTYPTSDWTGNFTGALTGIQMFNNEAGDSSDLVTNNLEVSGGAAVPEPSVAYLFVGGLGLLCVLKLRRKQVS